MAMERREDSTLTSPYVTPFGRSSMTAVCRGDKTEDEKKSGFSWFLFTPFSNTTVFYTYILLLLLFFAYPFCNSFIPPLTLVQSILFSSSSSYLMADGFVVGAVLFCHLILWGRASEKDMAADWREDSEANTCLKVFGQTLPLGSLLLLPILKGHPSMTAVGYEV